MLIWKLKSLMHVFPERVKPPSQLEQVLGSLMQVAHGEAQAVQLNKPVNSKPSMVPVWKAVNP